MSECSSNQPVSNYKPTECDWDHPEHMAQWDKVMAASLTRLDPARREEVSHAVERLRAQRSQRTHAILADSFKRIVAPIDRSSLRGKRDAAEC